MLNSWNGLLNQEDGDVEFDVDTAIQVCRQGRYFEQAAYLAQKFGEHDTFISVLVENLKQYSRALKYIKQLPPSEVFAELTVVDGRLERIYMRTEKPFSRNGRKKPPIYSLPITQENTSQQNPNQKQLK